MKLPFASLLAALWLISALSTPASEPVIPLPRAHSHNDYEHTRPLLDALELGFCSVEADIYLVEGKLLVAHNRDQVKPERTLQALYLEPLRARARANGGRVFPGGPTLTLLIDLKSVAESTYAALKKVLAEYEDMVTVFDSGKVTEKAVTVIISGSRPEKTMAAETRRLAGLDGRMPDLESTTKPKELYPLVSDSWRTHFKWNGTGPLPDEEAKKLADFVAKAHAQGRRIRFWAAPDKPEAWAIFDKAGVDLINTDNLAALKEFLVKRKP